MIVTALAGAGMRLSLVGPSKFDWIFGDASRRSGIFTGVVDGTQVRADVLFLDRPVVGLTACTKGPPWTFTVSVAGGHAVTGGGMTPAYFALNERVFVMATDPHVRDALRAALALTVPVCREPATLPVLQEEAAVVAAIESAGIQLTLIGASKFENLLGERQRARVFIEQAGAGGAGADVLFLEQPVRGVRVCVSRMSSGLNRSEIFIGDRLVSSGEGTQAILYSVSDRYFIQAVGSRFHTALMRGLGTVEPPCQATRVSGACIAITSARSSAAPREASRTPRRRRTSS